MSFLKKIFSSKKEEFEEAIVLLEESSPSCPITAVVEQDNRVAYLYLWGPKGFDLKSCWIRNLKEAPQEIESSILKKGIPPMMPEENCKSIFGRNPLNKADLNLVWLEEGDGVALLESGEPLAIIPSWSGYSGFNGYSKEAKGHGEFAWELTRSNDMHSRIKTSTVFWDSWRSEINPFQIEQPKLLNAYNAIFGESDRYFSIEGENGLPRGVYFFERKEKVVFASVGVSLIPMPQVEVHTENRFDLNRIEIGLMLNFQLSESNIQNITQWFGNICSIPWQNLTFLSEGHTVFFDAFNHASFKSVLLTNKLSVLPNVELENYNNSHVHFLWLVPITEKERQFAIDNGSTSLINRLNTLGQEIYSLDRKASI